MTSSVAPVGSVDEASTQQDPYAQYNQYQAYWDSVDSDDKEMTTTQLYTQLEYGSAKNANFSKQVQQSQQENKEIDPDELSGAQ